MYVYINYLLLIIHCCNTTTMKIKINTLINKRPKKKRERND